MAYSLVHIPSSLEMTHSEEGIYVLRDDDDDDDHENDHDDEVSCVCGLCEWEARIKKMTMRTFDAHG